MSNKRIQYKIICFNPRSTEITRIFSISDVCASLVFQFNPSQEMMKTKQFFLFSFIALFLFQSILHTKEATQGYTIIEDQAKTPIKTSTFSERKVLKIKLDNGLQAILISDPKTDQSAATLAVEAGSWQDPDQYPGIAHFLEHMLFMGTKKYPKESEYQNFITEHGGYSNAFTANDFTAYMFSVDNPSFPEALDRFASFFKEPLFNPSGVSRELNAIDQEYAKNFENEDIREIMVVKELENPKHPNYRFTMGNTSTLSAVSQETLKKWYQEHYSANLMRLMVISNLPTDELVKLVVEGFGGINNSNKQSFKTLETIGNPEYSGKIIYIQPIKNIRTLTLLWELPPRFAEMKNTSPEKLVCYVLGHEGKESLLAELKREKLAESVGCSAYRIGNHDMLFFLEIDLTDEGIEHVEHVILRTFQTIAMMKEKPFPQYLFDEVKQVNLIDYEFQNRQDAFDTAMKNAETLTGEDIATYPEQTKIIQKFSPEDVRDLLNYMTPENARFFVKAPVTLTGEQPNKKERWLDVPYVVKEISPLKMKEFELARPIPEITLPPDNPFLPDRLELLNPPPKEDEKLPLVPFPKLIEDSGKGKVYYSPDERYLIPQLYLYFNIKTPSIEMSKPAKAVIADLYVKAVEEALSRFSYPATMAGLYFEVDTTDFGVSFKIRGYSDNAHLLFEEILKQIKDVAVIESKFKLYKQSLLRDYHNFNKETPLKRAIEFFHLALYKNYTLNRQKALALRKLTFQKFDQALQEFFKQAYVEGLIYGNVMQNQAQEYVNKLLTTLQSQPYPVKDQSQVEVIVLPEDQGPFLFESKIPAQGNAALLAIENPDYTFKNRGAQQILMKAISEPFFTNLRTKQQTGYIVISTPEELERKLFNLFAVQSNTHDPRDLIARFELFFESFLQEMGRSYLTKENFEVIKASVLAELEKPQNNMEEMGNLLIKLAFKYDGQFDWMDKRIQGLKDLTYEEFLAFSKATLSKANKRRLAVLTKGTIPDEFSYTKVPDISQVKKLSTFSSGENNPTK